MAAYLDLGVQEHPDSSPLVAGHGIGWVRVLSVRVGWNRICAVVKLSWVGGCLGVKVGWVRV